MAEFVSSLGSSKRSDGEAASAALPPKVRPRFSLPTIQVDRREPTTRSSASGETPTSPQKSTAKGRLSLQIIRRKSMECMSPSLRKSMSAGAEPGRAESSSSQAGEKSGKRKEGVVNKALGKWKKGNGKRGCVGRRPSASKLSSWHGADKLERELGDTVISVAISSDDTCFAAGGQNMTAKVRAGGFVERAQDMVTYGRLCQ
eukprot:275652-Pleurochrysis_carterae.AAC.1